METNKELKHIAEYQNSILPRHQKRTEEAIEIIANDAIESLKNGTFDFKSFLHLDLNQNGKHRQVIMYKPFSPEELLCIFLKRVLDRNKLDYLLTDIMPVEVSELFSFSKFYEYLLSKQSTLDDIVSKMRAMKAENSETPFAGGKWGNWATSPLKFNILKGTDSIRGLNLVQPLSAKILYCKKSFGM